MRAKLAVAPQRHVHALRVHKGGEQVSRARVTRRHAVGGRLRVAPLPVELALTLAAGLGWLEGPVEIQSKQTFKNMTSGESRKANEI